MSDTVDILCYFEYSVKLRAAERDTQFVVLVKMDFQFLMNGLIGYVKNEFEDCKKVSAPVNSIQITWPQIILYFVALFIIVYLLRR